jgi:predicted TIM-barrel fold metal-dependent hydrolase
VRCVEELGFVGCNLNPDPSTATGPGRRSPTATGIPLYEKLAELDVPAMVHVSTSCNPNFHATGAHYINGDTTCFHAVHHRAISSGTSRRSGSSSRTAAARCRITGDAIAGSRRT